ncbi:MAG: hypothetical protein IPP79_12760 [Chitinophagaceae bacterium]|nr:hypothetical protein [Chitinophagaceae bacterium]
MEIYIKNSENFYITLKTRSVQIAKRLKENSISVTTTIWLCESFLNQRFDLKLKLKEIELKYANPKIIEGTPIYKLGWLPTKNSYGMMEKIIQTQKIIINFSGKLMQRQFIL